MRFDRLLQGRLLRRYKRFLADVEMPGGQVVTAHCPNTGAMTGCAEPGSRVWLSTSAVKTRKYPHTWELVETASGMACIHSARANTVVREAFAAALLPGFEGYKDIRAEVKYGQGSRADLLLQGPAGRVYVEVKSVTLCRGKGQGAFPDAVSERGRKHLGELRSVLAPDTRAVLFFCVFHTGVNAVSAAGDIDPAYRDALADAQAAGVEVLAWGADISTAGINLARALPFTLDPPPGR
ncbi:MAG: DNA/RNA nuclease SfsA [Gammaproteobacteria bacterium]|jgi:sugar fermentation stimulation protein A|nr:DNA/RNA nuclease SfsA [Gammaproteobacteria bacterium]MDH5170906.1 DNA/RNA nuclease SfsA [Gammaproteobacteria bacterium]